MKYDRIKIALFIAQIILLCLLSFNLGKNYGMRQPIYGRSFFVRHDFKIDEFREEAMKKYPQIRDVISVELRDRNILQMEVVYSGYLDGDEISGMIKDIEE